MKSKPIKENFSGDFGKIMKQIEIKIYNCLYFTKLRKYDEKLATNQNLILRALRYFGPR
jgi:hypothetical protein